LFSVGDLHEPLLVNIAGHAAGAIIFGIFLVLFLSDRRGARLRDRSLTAVAGGLAFLWNVSSLASLAALYTQSAFANLLITVSFCVLSLLPAVLLQLSLEDGPKAVWIASYTLSISAITFHIAALITESVGLRSIALLLITIGYSVLTLGSAMYIAFRNKNDTRGLVSRVLAPMCLFLFAISFVHFGSDHPIRAWSSELAIHHGGIPIALFILLRDYRFVLLDAFVRFLANVCLAVGLAFVAMRAEFQRHVIFSGDPLHEAWLLGEVCLLLIVFAMLRGQIQTWLTRFVFRRSSLEDALARLNAIATGATSESVFLEAAAKQVAEYASASRFHLTQSPRLAAAAEDQHFAAYPPGKTRNPEEADGWVEAIVPLRVIQGTPSFILLSRRLGGRRYLSEDFQDLGRLAGYICEQVERLRISESERLMTHAELQALQAQINPHFLFNSLNALYGLIPRGAEGARKTVINLSQIFRYFLQTQKTFIPLAEELQIVKAYLEIEKFRLGDRISWTIDVDPAVLSMPIPTLSIEPLVENAVKHGISASEGPGSLHVSAKLLGPVVMVSVENTGPPPGRSPRSGEEGAGVGLANVRRRLELCYGKSATLNLQSRDNRTTVTFQIPAQISDTQEALAEKASV
jgi:two-component system, LytTR family, sensor kinase